MKIPRIALGTAFIIMGTFLICHKMIHQNYDANELFFQSMSQLTDQDVS